MTRLTSFLLFHRGKPNILRKLGAHDRAHAITIAVTSDILRFEVPVEQAKQYAAGPHWLSAAILLDSESLGGSARPEADDLAIPHAELQYRPTLSVSDWQEPGNRPRRKLPRFLIAVASVPAFDDGSCRVDRRAGIGTVGNQLSHNAAAMESHLPHNGRVKNNVSPMEKE